MAVIGEVRIPGGLYRSLAAVAAGSFWAVIGTRGDFHPLVPLVATGALAYVAGWRGDSTAARIVYGSSIVGAVAGAWVVGPVGVLPGQDPAFVSSYHAMLVVIAIAVSVVFGGLAAIGGYRLGGVTRIGTNRH